MEFMHWKSSPKTSSMYWDLSNEEAMREHDDLEPELQSLKRINKYFDRLPNLLEKQLPAPPSAKHGEANQQSHSQFLLNLPCKAIRRLLWPSSKKTTENEDDLDLKIQRLIEEVRKTDEELDQKLKILIKEARHGEGGSDDDVNTEVKWQHKSPTERVRSA